MNSTLTPDRIRCFLYRLAFCLLRDVAINRRTMSHVPEV
jgi:hypothetical protein